MLIIEEEDEGVISREFVEKSENPETYRVTESLLRNLAILDTSDTQLVLQMSLNESQVS